MPDESVRKIQKTGGSTFIVSLPKKWVTKSGLREGQPVSIAEGPDGALTLHPRPHERRARRKKQLRISDDEPPAHLLRRLIGVYLAGYSVIELDAQKRINPATRKAARDFTRLVMGPEIIEETGTAMVLQDISDATELPLDKALRRMYLVVRAMHDDAISALKESNAALADDVISRDSEMDKLYWMIAKQHNMVISDSALSQRLGTDPWKSLNYKLAAKILERMGDHTERIAQEVKDMGPGGVDARLASDIAAASVQALDVLDKAVESLFKEDVGLANLTIDMGERLKGTCQALVGRVQKSRGPPSIHLVGIIESIRRFGLYGADIAEIAINHVMSRD